MQKYKEKEFKKYVIADLSSPTQYLKKNPGKNEYLFVEDISVATKAKSLAVANQILTYFYQDTGLDIELVVVPIQITYEILEA